MQLEVVATRRHPRSEWCESFAIATAVFLLVWALRQSKFHGMDAQYFIGLVRDHSSATNVHRLYLPLMHHWHAMLEPFGLSPFQSLRFASAVGVGVGTLCLHRACVRLGCDRLRAVLVTALAATTPAVVFFGTVVEIHGVFFAFVGLAFWQWARAVVAGGWPRFGVLGACTALAAAVHTSGHLLLWLLALVSWGLQGRRWPRLHASWRSWLVTACAHAATTFVFASLLPTASGLPHGGLAAMWARLPWSPPMVATIAWREWLWPFSPLSLVTLAALAASSVRRLAIAVLAGTLPFFGLVWTFLYGQLYERGAYVLPFVWPAALLLCLWLPRWAQVSALLVSFTLAVAQVIHHDRVDEDPTLVTGVRTVMGGASAFLICRDIGELDQVARDLPAVAAWPIVWMASTIPLGYARMCAVFDRMLDPYLDEGQAVLVSNEAHELLHTYPLPIVQQFAREHVPDRYELTPLHGKGFAGYRLTRRRV